MSARADFLTLLQCEPGHRATKLIRPGEILGYNAGTWFSAETVPVDSLESLAAATERVSRDPRAFIIRGELLPGVDPGKCRRLLHEQEDGAQPTFREVARRWVFFDFDGIQE